MVAAASTGRVSRSSSRDCDEHLHRLHEELAYRPLSAPASADGCDIPKAGKPGETRPLGIPAVYDRVCQQALLNRLEPIFEPIFDDSSFGYRPGRSAKDALRKMWREIEAGAEWIVDADLKDYFGTIDHEKLMTLVAQRVADGRVLTLIEQMLTAGYMEKGAPVSDAAGHPARRGGLPLAEQHSPDAVRSGDAPARIPADAICRRLGGDVQKSARSGSGTAVRERRSSRPWACGSIVQKTRIVHVRQGFAFLGYKIKRGQRGVVSAGREDHVRERDAGTSTRIRPRSRSTGSRTRSAGRRGVASRCSTAQLIRELNPLIRGWGEYYKRAHVRRLFNQLDRWVVRRLWSHRYRRWRCAGWKTSVSERGAASAPSAAASDSGGYVNSRAADGRKPR